MNQSAKVANAGNWISGWLDPRQPNNTDNTNTLLLLEPKWAVLGPYSRSANVYRCIASKVTAKEGGRRFPVVRTVSMNGWMGPNAPAWNPGFTIFAKTAQLTKLPPAQALVYLDEREDSIDDGYYAIDMTKGAGAVLALMTPGFFSEQEHLVRALSAGNMPASFGLREFADRGGLMSYGANIVEMYDRVADYVAKILKGAKPADLPIEQPTKFELVINLKTAKALGLSLPQSILARADEVIE